MDRPLTRSILLSAGPCLLTLLSACGGGSGSSGNGAPPPPPPAQGGLDARPSNLTCVAPPRSGSDVEVALERVFENLSFTQPLGMLQAPGDDSRWFVLEKGGRVRVFANDPDVAGFELDFITLQVNAASEGGLLGMAFHPDFQSNGEVFLSWTEDSPMVSVVARFTSLDGGLTLDPGSEDVIRIHQDQQNHNGGHVAFGPDGYLYLGLGDGGGAGDTRGRAQDTTNLLGAFLRLDVDGEAPYAIPPDNPFAENPACPADHTGSWDCPEIYAWGLRNPWRWSFDRETGTLWAGDVGQSAREEIDHIERGGNYGWNCREGTSTFAGADAACAAAAGLIDPVFEYTHDQGRSVTGGYVYRGSGVPALAGQYVFGDFVSGRLWRLLPAAGGHEAEELAATSLAIASLAEDAGGELYVVSLGGTLHRLVAAAPPAAEDEPPVPRLLSATGCVDGSDPSLPAPGLIPYGVAVPAWFDGANRARWLALPNGTALSVNAEDRFELPSGAVLVELFRFDERPIETRLLMRHPDGEWAGYSYEWDADGTDASLVEGGKTASIGEREWLFPSGAQCLGCHTAAAGVSLGLETAQLNHELSYPATGRTANQLATLDAIALFDAPLGDPEVLPAFAQLGDDGESVEDRARAYLHVNCAHCHRPGAPAPSGLDLRHATLLDQTGACDVAPQRGDLGIPDARLIAPGEPDRSVLLERLSRRDAHGMPPFGSLAVDEDGAALVAGWIAQLSGCR